jgi:glutamate dehydrogenase (NAD(P)+)
MNQAFETVWQTSQQTNLSLRTAAYIIGITRVQRAAELAGFASA